MTRNSETICDDNGIEIIVDYYYDKSESQLEEGHGTHEVGCLVETQLKSVEVVIAGTRTQIISLLTERQKDEIISKLNYD